MKNIFLSTIGGLLIVITLLICGVMLEDAFQMERTGTVLMSAALGPMFVIENFLPPENSDNSNPAPYDHEIRMVGLLIGLCCCVLVYALPIYTVLRRNERSVYV